MMSTVSGSLNGSSPEYTVRSTFERRELRLEVTRGLLSQECPLEGGVRVPPTGADHAQGRPHDLSRSALLSQLLGISQASCQRWVPGTLLRKQLRCWTGPSAGGGDGATTPLTPVPRSLSLQQASLWISENQSLGLSHQ